MVLKLQKEKQPDIIYLATESIPHQHLGSILVQRTKSKLGQALRFNYQFRGNTENEEK